MHEANTLDPTCCDSLAIFKPTRPTRPTRAFPHGGLPGWFWESLKDLRGTGKDTTMQACEEEEEAAKLCLSDEVLVIGAFEGGRHEIVGYVRPDKWERSDS